MQNFFHIFLSFCSTSDVQTHLSTYNKVLFVRHPIARLHSLYKLYTSFLHSDIKNNTINSIKAKIKAKLQRTSTVDPKKYVNVLNFNQYIQTTVSSKIWKMRYMNFNCNIAEIQ